MRDLRGVLVLLCEIGLYWSRCHPEERAEGSGWADRSPRPDPSLRMTAGAGSLTK
jgi:hypothetical protein